MFNLILQSDGIDYNLGHFARYSGIAFDANQSHAWREGWNKANCELARHNDL